MISLRSSAVQACWPLMREALWRCVALLRAPDFAIRQCFSA